MKVSLGDATLSLVEDAPVSLRSARGVRLTCTEGMLWMTQELDARDLHLSAGESFVIEGNGLIVVEGYPKGGLRISNSGQRA